MSAYDQIINPVFRKVCETAEQEMKTAVKGQRWGEANAKKGYLNGIAFRFINASKYSPEELDDHAEEINKRVANAVQMTDYGRAQYWKSFLNGWGVACVMVAAAVENGVDESESAQ